MVQANDISSILSSLASLLVGGGVDEETVRRLTPDLTTWVESFASRLEEDETKVDKQIQRHRDELTLK